MGLMSKLAFAAAASALSLLAAEAQAEVTVVVPQLDEPRTLSPNFSSDTGGYAPSSNIYSHLVTMDWGVVKGTPAYGDLAESWETSEDGKTVTFKLLKNVKWHDGKPLTSADVKFTFDTMLKKKYPYAAFLGNVAEIATPDDYTVVLKLKTPDMSFVPMMAQAAGWTGKIYPKHLWENQDGFDKGPNVNNPIGSGPFKFVRWEKGGPVELAANPDYFRGKPAIDRLIFRHITDANVARAEFDSGQLYYLPYDYAPPLAEVPALQRDKTIEVVFTPSHYSRDIQLNLRKPPLNNLKVRQAIATAIDRDAINRSSPSTGCGNRRSTPASRARSSGSTATLASPTSTRPRPKSCSTRPVTRRAADGWRFAVGDNRADLFGLQGHERSARAAAAAGRHQRQARAVRPGDLVQPHAGGQVRHQLLLHPLWTRSGRLSRAFRDRRAAQLHGLQQPRVRRARRGAVHADRPRRTAEASTARCRRCSCATCPTSTCSTSRRRA